MGRTSLAVKPKMTEAERAEWLRKRTGDVTSTEVSALFNCSPYLTRFELWHRKRDKVVVEAEENERMKWGTRLEPAIAAGIAEDMGWKVRPMKEYLRDAVARVGASFDFAIGKDGLLEIKNVDQYAYKDGWIVEGDYIEAPPHIELQVQQQLLLSGRRFAYIGALVGGNSVRLIKREPQRDIFDAIRAKAVEFWKTVDAGEAPAPDFERDAAFIAELYKRVTPGKILDAKDAPGLVDLVAAYTSISEQRKALDGQREACKARMLTIIGDAEKVKGETFTISCGKVAAKRVEAYDVEEYRGFGVYPKKPKEGEPKA